MLKDEQTNFSKQSHTPDVNFNTHIHLLTCKRNKIFQYTFIKPQISKQINTCHSINVNTRQPVTFTYTTHAQEWAQTCDYNTTYRYCILYHIQSRSHSFPSVPTLTSTSATTQTNDPLTHSLLPNYAFKIIIMYCSQVVFVSCPRQTQHSDKAARRSTVAHDCR